MYVIGITGSIGSGKSTVARMLGDMMDTPVIDADAIARELVEPGREALVSIVETFGNKMVLRSGKLNRKRLADLIFSNSHARKQLNKIMFPLVRKRTLEYFNAHIMVGRQYLIFDAPLLFESKMFDLVDYIALVHVPHEVQVQRIMDRNGLSSREAEERISAQPSGEKLKGMPIDYLIQNTTDYVGLNAMVDKLWKHIRNKRKS